MVLFYTLALGLSNRKVMLVTQSWAREIQIPLSEIEFSYVRSSGPGGQNVNKVNSKAVLRWNLAKSASLDLEKRSWLLNRLSSRLTVEGEIVIASDRYRDQQQNREDCLEKLRELLARAVSVPKMRKPTRPTRSSRSRNKEAKTRHSEKKSQRRYRANRVP